MAEGESIPAPPSVLLEGKYRLTRRIGRGGMGEVWEGVHETLGTRVAIKFIDAELARNKEARARFDNEARAAARLQTKYVVSVFDHGMLPDGRPYIVMEYLDGEALDVRLEREGRLSPEETATILQQVARGLSRAHAAGIVHRDLKPENVFIVRDEEDCQDIAKVVDFGVAKFTEGNLGATSATRTGSLMGTPYYMSPEQARGLRTLDFRSDLWAMGVLAYRCITGELPFVGEAVGDLLVKVCTSPLPVPSKVAQGISPNFDAWFARALERDPEKRFASAVEQSDALAIALLGDGAVKSDSARHAHGPPASGAIVPSRKHPRATVPAAAAAAAAAAAGVTMGPVTQTPTMRSHRQGARSWLIAGVLLGLSGAASWAAWQYARPQPTSAAPVVASSEPAVAVAGADSLPAALDAAPESIPDSELAEPHAESSAPLPEVASANAESSSASPSASSVVIKAVPRPAARRRARSRPATPKPRPTVDLGY